MEEEEVVLLNGGAGQGLNPNVYLVGLEPPLWGRDGLQCSLLWRSVVPCLFQGFKQRGGKRRLGGVTVPRKWGH